MLGRSRIATSAAFASQGLLFAVLLTHLPQFKDTYGIDDTAVTLIIVGVTVLAGVGSVVAGVAAGRWGSGATLAVALMGEVAAAVLIAVAPGLMTFCVAFAVYGVALGAVDATSNMQAVDVEHRIGRSVLTSFHAAWSAAGIIGSLWTALCERVGVPLGLSVGAAALVVAGLTTVTWRRFVPASTPNPVPTSSERPARIRLGLPFALLGTALALFYVADSGTSSWSAIYLDDVLGAGAGIAALGYAGYQAMAVVSRLLGDHGVRRWGAPAVVRVGAVIGISGMVVVVLAGGPWAAIAGFSLVGLGLPVVAPLCFAAAGRLAPGAADEVIARLNLFNYVGALAGGALVGAVGSAAGLRTGFVVPLVLAVGVLVLAPAFETRTALPAAAR